MRKQLLFAFALFQLNIIFVFGQQNTKPSLWSTIELSLRTKKNLDSTYRRLLDVKAVAQKNNDPSILARAYCYLMLL